MTSKQSDDTDWIAYLEAEPKSEPYLSIAAALRRRDNEIERLRAAIRGIQVEIEGVGIGCTKDFHREALNSTHQIAESALKGVGVETSPYTAADVATLTSALIAQEDVLREGNGLLRELLDEGGVNFDFTNRLEAYWKKADSLSDWRTRELPLPKQYKAACEGGTGGPCTQPDCEVCWPDPPVEKKARPAKAVRSSLPPKLADKMDCEECGQPMDDHLQPGLLCPDVETEGVRK